MSKAKRPLSAYNLYMRKALKGKMTGKTKAQRKAIFKAAAKGWNKGKPKSSPRSQSTSRASPSRRANPTGGRKRMTKNSFNMNKIYGAVRKVAVFVPALTLAMQPWSNEAKVKTGIRWYFGWNMDTMRFDWSQLWQGWGPAVGAQVITRVIPLVNRIIRSFF